MIVASKEFVVKKMTELMLTPKKKFSQNFLTDYEAVKASIDSLGDSLQTIEIGPGLGALTQEMDNRNIKVDAYDIDKDMFNHLSTFFENSNNVKVYNEDFMKVDLSKYQEEVNIMLEQDIIQEELMMKVMLQILLNLKKLFIIKIIFFPFVK
jgi:16S rRNA (adenine1518-N6/adenine1519-N6)-dimethyltransferase